MTIALWALYGVLLLVLPTLAGFGRFAKLLVRMEKTLDRMEAAAAVVAENLAASVSRADATTGPEGAAADAALRTGDTADAIHQRQDERQDRDDEELAERLRLVREATGVDGRPRQVAVEDERHLS